MSIFDLFKKKKTSDKAVFVSALSSLNKKKKGNATPPKESEKKPSVEFEITHQEHNDYDPWEDKKLPRNENYATAAMLYRCQGGKPIGKSKDDFPRNLNYDFKINDPVKYQKKLIDTGYLVESGPDNALRKFQVAELKSILEKNNLPVKGRKAELIQRIIDNVNTESLNLEKYYVPSEKGLEHLKKYKFVFSLRQYNITTDQYDNYANEYSYAIKPNDVIWRILNERFNKYNIEKQFGSACSELRNMANLLISEKRLTDGLYFLILVMYYDTSGLGNSGYIINGSEYTPGRLDIDPVNVLIAPGIVRQIFEYKEYYMKEMVERCYRLYKLPFHYLTIEQFEALLNDIFEDEPIDFRKYVKASMKKK